MNFTDAVTIAGTRRTDDGYLAAEAKAVRTGIQLYTGDEVGKPELSGSPEGRGHRGELEGSGRRRGQHGRQARRGVGLSPAHP